MYRIRRSVIIKRNLEQKINHFLMGLILIFLLPVFITTFFSKRNVEELISAYPSVQITEDEAMLPQIVAKQIGISMPDECIKAQAVVARTNLREAMKLGKSIPDGMEFYKFGFAANGIPAATLYNGLTVVQLISKRRMMESFLNLTLCLLKPSTKWKQSACARPILYSFHQVSSTPPIC